MIIEPLIYPVFINFPYIQSPLREPLDPSEYTLSLNFLEPIDYPFVSHVQFDENNNLFLTIDNNDLITIGGCYSLYLNLHGKKYIINNQIYPTVLKYLDLDTSNEKGIFTFTSSKPVLSPVTNTIQDENGITFVPKDAPTPRCDRAMNGPMVFLRPNEEPISSDFNSTIIGSLEDLTLFHPIISVDGVGHIIYVKLVDPSKESFDVNQNNMPKATRSIGELLKLMIEWQNVSFNPWNSNEEISLACKEFFELLNMPQLVLDSIEENQCDFQVYRYLKGNLNARERPPVNEIRNLNEIARKWLNSHFFYYSIEGIFKNIG